MEIRKKKKIPIRDVWKNEARDFTPWLVDHLEELSEAMQQDITVTDAVKEVSSGRYAVDIVGKIGEDTVIIENQLEKSDHSHLGQCITYAAVHKAKYLIWIAETFQPEELSSVDWLNENFSFESGIKFFAVEVSAWKTEDDKGNLSEYAIPHFKVLREPDVELKELQDEKHAESVTERQKNRLTFWKKFFDIYGKINSKWADVKPKVTHYRSRRVGISGVSFTVCFKGNSFESKPAVELSIESSNAEKCEQIFQDIYKDKESIEKKWNQISNNELIWTREEHNKHRDIRVVSDLEIDFSNADEELKKKCMDWFIENMKKFEDIFTPIVNELLKNKY